MYLARKYHLGTLYFTPPNGDGTAILRGHPSHAKVQPLSGQREYLHFSVILRPWVLVRPRESNPRPPALQSSALPTELILQRFFVNSGSFFHCACLPIAIWRTWIRKFREHSNKVAKRSPISWNFTREPREFAGSSTNLWRRGWSSLF